jgi:transcriptional regulator with GAF, ATPase, and Fis domain
VLRFHLVADGVDPSLAARSVERLRQADLTAGEVEASLRAVVQATATVFDADGAGVMLLDDQQAMHYVGATGGRAAALEAAQEETGEGPCVDALMHDVTIHTDDLLNDPRWPQLRSQIGELGIRAVLGVPLRLGLSPVGSLNVYRLRPWSWQDSDRRAIEAHGRIVEEVLGTAMMARRHSTIVDQLTSALRNRVAIERAIGVVMAERKLDPVKAFNELRHAARRRRIKVAELAEEVLASQRFRPVADEDEVRA